MAGVYALDKQNNYIPTMSREEIIAAIQTAAAGGSFEGFDDCAFITQIKEINRDGVFSVWVGTQSEYNALAEHAKNVLYIISDDPMCNDLPNRLNKVVETQQATAEALTEMQNTIKEQGDSAFALSEKVTEAENSIKINAEEIKALKDANSEIETMADQSAAKVDSLTPQLIYNNSSGATTCKTTKPITAFNEIVVVYAVYNNELNQISRRGQARYVSADIGSTMYLTSSWPTAYSDTEKAVVNSVGVFSVTYYSADTLFLATDTATDVRDMDLTSRFKFVITKIYGVGLK